jgi:hypothetical protein
MHNAEESSGQPSDRTRVLPTYRRLRARSGRIRYAHDETGPRNTGPRAEPYCTVSQRASGHYAADGGRLDPDLDVAWSAQVPVAGRRNDVWVLVCGGIATAAAFAAAFVASGGAASHAATYGTTGPTAVSRACPSPAP